MNASLTLVLLLAFVIAPTAAAYSQNRQLELELRMNDPRALALFPAKGFRDGAAGFFKTHALHVVPGSERAWCQDQDRGTLKRGCYVEFTFQGNGLRPRTKLGAPCGRLGRWYRAPGARDYVPTPGAYYSKAIANDESELIDSAIYAEIDPACR